MRSQYEREARLKGHKAHALAIVLFVTFPIWVLPWALFELYKITEESTWEWLNRREDKRRRDEQKAGVRDVVISVREGRSQ